jgi:uncharacterized protein (TIGR00369 family)
MPDRTTPQHSAPVRWHDSDAVLGHVRPLSGLELVTAMRDGTLPMDAFATALGARVIAADAGRVTLGATVRNWQVNIGVVAHGGFLSTLMDLACGLAVQSTLPAGRASPHAQAGYRFIRTAPRAARLTCLGEVVHHGRTLAIARAEVTDDDGRLIALGDATHAYVDLPPR